MQTSLELEELTVFLTGARRAPAEVPWRMLSQRDATVVRAWAAEAFPHDRARRVLRSFERAVRHQPHASEDTEPALDEHVAPVRISARRRPTPRRSIPARDLRLLLDACASDNSAAGRRDAAIIALMALGGARPTQLVRLDRGDFDETTGLLRLRSAPGNRFLTIEEPCLGLLDAWLRARGGGSGPLFKAVDSAGAVRDHGIGAGAVNAVLARRCRAAGLARLTAGELRAAFLASFQRLTRQLGAAASGHYYRGEDGEAGWLVRTLLLE